MSKIIFDSGISLDGFFAGDNRSPSELTTHIRYKLNKK